MKTTPGNDARDDLKAFVGASTSSMMSIPEMIQMIMHERTDINRVVQTSYVDVEPWPLLSGDVNGSL